MTDLALIDGDGGGTVSEGSAGLLIRVWVDSGRPDDVRARLMTLDADGTPRTWATAGNRAAVLAALQTWVGQQLAEATGRTGGATP